MIDDNPSRPRTSEPAADLWQGAASGWRRSLPMLAIAISGGAAAVALAVIAPGLPTQAALLGIAAAVLALYAAVVLAVSALTALRVLVQVDAGWLRVRGWPMALRSDRVARDCIAAVEVVEASSTRWDPFCWMVASGRDRHVVRSGPALRVVLTSGRVLTVSVDHPEQAAAVLAGSGVRSTACRNSQVA